MDVIRQLQQQLAEAQAVSNRGRISERNCIDLVQKLIQTERVKLLHTTSGKEWLTPEQLDREIRDALLSNGGRLSVMEIPNEVGVWEAKSNLRHPERSSERRARTRILAENVGATGTCEGGGAE